MSRYAEGDPRSKIAYICEAPAAIEMRQNRCLVGPTGVVFDQLLHSSGMIRREAYIGNICRSRIKSGDEILGKKGWTDLGRDEFDAFRERLDKVEANVLVPMGNIALFALTGKFSITKWRGSVLECTVPGHEGRKVLPTIHPAATIRGQYTWRHLIINDLRKAKVERHFP